MPWETVAEGTSISNLQSVVGEMELPKGTRMKVEMDLKVPVGGAFNFVAAEWLAKPFVPDGMELVDVSGSGSQGIVEMEADPAWLLAVLGFIKAHWLALTIAGFALWLIISLITISVKVPAFAQIPFWLIAGAGIALVGLTILARRRVPT